MHTELSKISCQASLFGDGKNRGISKLVSSSMTQEFGAYHTGPNLVLALSVRTRLCQEDCA